MKTVIVFVSHVDHKADKVSHFVEVEQVGFFQNYKTVRQLVKQIQTNYNGVNRLGHNTFRIENVVVA